MAPSSINPVRVAAIDFLNPAPLMWDFEHPPLAAALAHRYQLHYTLPAQCADELLAARADLGLIPIASLTPDLAIVPGCVIASLDRVLSIQLIVKHPHTIGTIKTIAADTASRSSLAYAEIIFRMFLGIQPVFLPAPANPVTMLRNADAAILIGDPALLALENRAAIEAQTGPCTWHDLAHEWHTRTGLPWVAAVWAVRPDAVNSSHITPQQLTEDLNNSRIHGLANIDNLVHEWTPRIALPPAAIRDYLTGNIHYTLDEDCIRAIQTFRQCAAVIGILPPLPNLRFLNPTAIFQYSRDFLAPTRVLTSMIRAAAAILSIRSAAVDMAVYFAQSTARHGIRSNPFIHFLLHFGFFGVLLVSIVDSSFVPLPLPGVTDIMIIVMAAQHENWFLLVLLATIGSALGGYFSYQVGHSGGMAFLEKHVPPRIFNSVTHWMENNAILSVALPAILPPPAPLSPFVLAAGALNMSRKKFLYTFTISRAIRHTIAAWLGIHYGRAVIRLWNSISDEYAGPVLIVLWIGILLSCAYGFWKLYKTSRAVAAHPSITSPGIIPPASV